MKELVTLEARNALLEHQLRDIKFRLDNLAGATGAPATSAVSDDEQIQKPTDVPQSSEIDETGHFVRGPQAQIDKLVLLNFVFTAFV